MHLDKTFVVDALARLEQRDRRRVLFGSSQHQYRLNPPLPRAVLEAFEEQHAVSLPEDYRHFMTVIGNGGAGPHYGLFAFGEVEDGRPWDEGDLIGNVGEPFPHVEAWNRPDEFWSNEPDPPPGTPVEEEDRMMEAWDTQLMEHYWNPKIMNGAVPICDRGCGLSQWLIVNGPQRGYVWNDDRADHAGIYPLRDADGEQMTFSDWYLSWLETAESQRIAAVRCRRHASGPPATFREWVLLSGMVTGLLVGIAFAAWCDWSGHGILLAGLTTAFAAVGLLRGIDWLVIRRRQRRIQGEQ